MQFSPFLGHYPCRIYTLLQNSFSMMMKTKSPVSALWQNKLWSFQLGGTTLERFLHKNQRTWRKLLNFEFQMNGELSKIGHCFSYVIKWSKNWFYQKMSLTKCAPKFIFFNEKKRFLTLKIDFKSQILTLFVSSPLIQNSKFNNFLWVCWFLDNNISNVVSPVWKLHHLDCHKVH